MGITLKATRTNKKMRQIDAAKALGVSVYTIENYESGKTYPDVYMLKKYRKVIWLSLFRNYFFTQILHLKRNKNVKRRWEKMEENEQTIQLLKQLNDKVDKLTLVLLIKYEYPS